MEISAPVVDGLLVELAREERAALSARQAVSDARVRYDVALRKFAAVREAVASAIGRSPYAPDVKWPVEAREAVRESDRGRLRFAHMPTGDAVVAALREANQPLGLEQIIIHAHRGGLTLTPRATNAALINTPGIVKQPDGMYMYRPEKAGDDELPF